MSVSATAVTTFPSTQTSTYVVQPSEYANMRYLPVAVGDGTYLAGVQLGPGAASQYAAPGGMAHSVTAASVADAIAKGALVFASSADVATATT